jgi:hypothetical protein
MPNRIVAVIGASECDAALAAVARRVGAALARAGFTVVTGGLGGVMEAASEGARSAGGLVVGVLPGHDPRDANPFVDVAIATGIGDARNAILANTAAAFVAVGGAYGTLSEIAFALKRRKPVAGLGTWKVDPRVVEFDDPEAAVEWVRARVGPT